jgi:hypothetical protein
MNLSVLINSAARTCLQQFNKGAGDEFSIQNDARQIWKSRELMSQLITPLIKS